MFLHNNNKSQRKNSSSFEDEEEFITPQDSLNDEYLSEETFSVHHKSPLVSDFETETNEEEFHVQEDADSVPNRTTSSPITIKLYKSDELLDSDKKYDGINISHHRCILYSLVCFIIHMHHHFHKHF